MPIINWTNTYSVNSSEIDKQHKKLFDLINSLHKAMVQGKGKEILGQTLDALVDYARVHFTNEEKMLAKVNYPDLPAHKVEHAAFNQKVIDLQTDYRAGKLALTLQVMDFLKNWLTNHILKVDKKYVAYIKG
jgi:hemerythrin